MKQVWICRIPGHRQKWSVVHNGCDRNQQCYVHLMCEFGRSHIRVYVLHWFSNHHKPSVCIFKSGLSKDSMSSMSTGLTQRHLKRTAHCMGPLVLWADIDSGSKTSRHTTNDVSVGNKAVCRASLVPAWTQRCFSLLFFSDAEHNALSKTPPKKPCKLAQQKHHRGHEG